MRGVALATSLCMSLPFPATALSCMEPDPASSFTSAVESDARYTVLYGALEHAGPQTSEVRNSDGLVIAPPAPFITRFHGKGLSARGFVDVEPRDIVVELQCVGGHWCGHLGADGPILAFVERTTDGDVLRVGPCPIWIFQQPTPTDIATVESCMRGAACLPEFQQ
jgi:hypothetical protein